MTKGPLGVELEVHALGVFVFHKQNYFHLARDFWSPDFVP